MRSFLALMRREYQEHRGAFFWAPLALLGVLVLGTLLPFLAGRFRGDMAWTGLDTVRIYEIAFLGLSGLWWLYLFGALFFYFADAFTADRRGNAMLFWKSMPQTDLKILASKMAAGLALFPAILFGVMLLGGVWAYGVSLLADLSLPVFAAPAPAAAALAFGQVSLVVLATLVLSLLWYAPFFAWVGGLSTLVGRWSIPLAFLLPALVVLLENAMLPGTGPRGGYVLAFLRSRAEFEADRDPFRELVIGERPFEALPFIADLVLGIDWVAMAGGWAFVVVVLYLASEYRRRFILA